MYFFYCDVILIFLKYSSAFAISLNKRFFFLYFHSNNSKILMILAVWISVSLLRKFTRDCCQSVTALQVIVWNGMEDDFSIFHTGNFLPFHFHSILKIFLSIFHSSLKFSSVFYSILPYPWYVSTGSNA